MSTTTTRPTLDPPSIKGTGARTSRPVPVRFMNHPPTHGQTLAMPVVPAWPPPSRISSRPSPLDKPDGPVLPSGLPNHLLPEHQEQTQEPELLLPPHPHLRHRHPCRHPLLGSRHAAGARQAPTRWTGHGMARSRRHRLRWAGVCKDQCPSILRQFSSLRRSRRRRDGSARQRKACRFTSATSAGRPRYGSCSALFPSACFALVD
jgi:hypothetical protein